MEVTYQQLRDLEERMRRSAELLAPSNLIASRASRGVSLREITRRPSRPMVIEVGRERVQRSPFMTAMTYEEALRICGMTPEMLREYNSKPKPERKSSHNWLQDGF